jgi:thiol peroxidase
LSRSIIVIDDQDTIRFIQHVPEVTQEPDFVAVKALL